VSEQTNEKILEKMIWKVNWAGQDEELESSSNIDKLNEVFDYAIEHNLTDKITFLRLNIRDFRVLNKKYPSILRKASVTLFMNNIKEISLSELEELKRNYNIHYFQISSLHSLEKNSDMNIWIVYKYKKAIMKMVEGIDKDFLKDDPDREKKIFGKLIPKIVERVRYDESIQEKSIERHYKNLDRIIFHERNLHNAPSNEMLGLLKGRCVCRGYAGIVRDVFNEVDIDTNVVIGFNNTNIQNGHAWNQIKLDNEWFNMDVTWDLVYIMNRGESYWLLKDDYHFENGIILEINGQRREESHRHFMVGRTPGVPCNKNIPMEELRKYLDIEKIRKRLWLRRFVTNMEQKKKGKAK
jgi:hypothetical protein